MCTKINCLTLSASIFFCLANFFDSFCFFFSFFDSLTGVCWHNSSSRFAECNSRRSLILYIRWANICFLFVSKLYCEYKTFLYTYLIFFCFAYSVHFKTLNNFISQLYDLYKDFIILNQNFILLIQEAIEKTPILMDDGDLINRESLTRASPAENCGQ